MRIENLATSPESISKKQQLSLACTKEVVALATVAKKENMADRYTYRLLQKQESSSAPTAISVKESFCRSRVLKGKSNFQLQIFSL